MSLGELNIDRVILKFILSLGIILLLPSCDEKDQIVDGPFPMDSKILIIEPTKIRYLSDEVFEIKVGYRPGVDPTSFEIDFGNDKKVSILEEPDLNEGYYSCKY